MGLGLELVDIKPKKKKETENQYIAEEAHFTS